MVFGQCFSLLLFGTKKVVAEPTAKHSATALLADNTRLAMCTLLYVMPALTFEGLLA